MPGRWDGDERGSGVGDAQRLASGVGELLAAFQEPLWVAEQPEAHLLPHVEQWCQQDGRLVLRSASVDDQHTLVLDLEWRGDVVAVGHARAAVFSLIGSFAESATYVQQRRVLGQGEVTPGGLRFEVGTGELAHGRFLPHGHTVVIDVRGPVQQGDRSSV